MKKFSIIISILILFGCSKNDESKPSNNIILLQVDYMTNVFEGGKKLTLSTCISNSDTLPISVYYMPPSDFGSITLYYRPTNEMVFNGTIIWMGCGQIIFPESFDSANSFATLESELQQPDTSRFQIIFYELYNQPINYANIWNAISKLKIVSYYLNGSKKIGLFLYTPSVGIGDPNEWDWFVILNK